MKKRYDPDHINTFTASRSFGLSWRYLTIHVKALAVVSWAAKRAPITLSAIWSSVKTCPLSPFEFSRQPKRSFSSNLFSFLSLIMSPRILLSLFLACTCSKISNYGDPIEKGSCWIKGRKKKIILEVSLPSVPSCKESPAGLSERSCNLYQLFCSSFSILLYNENPNALVSCWLAQKHLGSC